MTSVVETKKIPYNDLPAKIMLYPAIIFMLIGMTFGVFIAFNAFVFPDYFAGEYIHFGRVRPVHVGHVLFLWLISANIGLIYFFIPRLCGVPLWSSELAYVACGFWWFSLIIGIYSFPWGTNFGWEYAELPVYVWWIPIKAIFTVAWLLTAFNIVMTIVTRSIHKMYVSVWYVLGTMLWTTFAWVVGNYIINYVPGGMSRVNVSFFYVHNLVGLVFTPMGLATAYYALPKLSNTPIYSHKLSMVGFWSIAFIYAWIGAHHIIHGPVSQWLQTTSIVFSIWLFIPVFTVVTNLMASQELNWQAYTRSAPIRFLIMGVIFYLITCVQGPLMALRNVNEITSKTDWVIGHSHVSLYSTFTFFAFAGIYQAIPILTKRPLWSDRLADWHFNLSMIGTFPFILSLWIGGYLQGMMWATWADGTSYAEFHNNLTILPFIQTNSDTRIWWIWRAIGGSIILIASSLFVLNIFNTVMLKPVPERKAAT